MHGNQSLSVPYQYVVPPESSMQLFMVPRTLRLMTMNRYIFLYRPYHVERGSSVGSSVGRMPDSQSREPGFESPLLPFRSLGIFFHFTTPQSTQLYK